MVFDSVSPTPPPGGAADPTVHGTVRQGWALGAVAALLVPAAASSGARLAIAPLITSVSVSRSAVPAGGGRITVRVATRHATTCAVGGVGFTPSHSSFPCARGVVLRLGVNAGTRPAVRTVFVMARDTTGRSSRLAHTYVTQLASRARLPAMRRLAPVSPSPAVTSRNWSGYVAAGGPFLGVQGTFTVPNLAWAPWATRASEWVGIDGRRNGYLIQAGVEQDYDPSTGLVSHYAWWQILPDHPTQVEIPLIVLPGDEITVVIGRRRDRRHWSIVVSDDTTGQTFSTRRLYGGPASSAEWIVEAPTTQGVQDTLGSYSPRVVFSSAGVAGSPAAISRVELHQGGKVRSRPSAPRNGSFAVSYRGLRRARRG
jgi:hypothetical protein